MYQSGLDYGRIVTVMLQIEGQVLENKAEMLAWAREQESRGMRRTAVAKALCIHRKTLWLWLKKSQVKDGAA